jgi:hypothetical protein
MDETSSSLYALIVIKYIFMAYYQCKVTFDSGEVNKQGKSIITKTIMLVEATGVTEAEARVVEHLKSDIVEFEVTSVSLSNIESVLQHNN